MNNPKSIVQSEESKVVTAVTHKKQRDHALFFESFVF